MNQKRRLTESFVLAFWGPPRTDDLCSACLHVVYPDELAPEVRKTYRTTGLCEKCQNDVGLIGD